MPLISIQVQDDEVGDGTTSVCVLASELLREAERLVLINLYCQLLAQVSDAIPLGWWRRS
jgi:chaperonin GroEL (HSP60 family)